MAKRHGPPYVGRVAPVRTMAPEAAAAILRRTLKDPTKPRTVADASVEGGLALRDAEAGLTWLTSEYRGHLRVTSEGELLHLFPTGFTKPWETKEAAERALSAVGRALVGAGRFIVRAWLLTVMVGYAALFVALVVGLTLARQSDSRDRGPGVSFFLGGLFRMIGDALFWTFHPFSPLYMGRGYGNGFYGEGFAYTGRRERRRGEGDDVPFYEKVNRFVFGPPSVPEDPHAVRARILAELRAKRGRIGLADVMRVTGLPRAEADPLMAQLMLDHDGSVEVSENGGIFYRFEAMRKTTAERAPARPAPAWTNAPKLPPLTGNPTGSNVAIALLNGFNLFASAWVMAHGLTLSNLALLFSKRPPPILPDDGLPLALGLVPFVFSLALFLLPLFRTLVRPLRERRASEERARLSVLREVLARTTQRKPVPDEALREAFRGAAGRDPSSEEITRRVVELGGDVDLESPGEVRYRFADLEAEAAALDEERARASETEARVGRVVFASDDESS